MGLLGDLTSFIDNKKRVAARNLWDSITNPEDFQAQWASQLNEDLAPLRDLNNPEAAVRLALDMGAGPSMGVVGAIEKRALGKLNFDPKFDGKDYGAPRKAVLEKMKKLETVVDNNLPKPPAVKLSDFEGRPFITSMSDRTDVMDLLGVNGVTLNRPVNVPGGQGFMFNDPNLVWASGKTPTKHIHDLAKIMYSETGKKPLFIPWVMNPTGSDFATMTGETMLSHANTALPKSVKKQLDKNVKQFIPDWLGVDNPASVQQFRSAKDSTRKSIISDLDKNFRDQGGLSLGETRLSIADPNQLNIRSGSIYNVGEIDPTKPIQQSTHPSYPFGVVGDGLGRVEGQTNIYQLLTNAAKDRKIADLKNPSFDDLRALQMKPYGGIIDERLLRSLLD